MFGIDYASVDENAKPNLALTIAAGLAFIIIRGSWDKWGEPTFKRDAAEARKLGIPVAGYIGPDISARASAPEDQVATFHRNAELIPGTDFPPIIDVEYPQGLSGSGMSPAENAKWIARMIVAVEDTYGCLPIVYTSARVLDDTDTDCLGGALDATIAGCALWLTHYVRGPRQAPYVGDAPPPRVPRGRDSDDWWIEQDQGDARGLAGFSSIVDVDKFNRAPLGVGRSAWVRARNRFPSIVEYQRAKGLAADGILGPKTFASLGWIKP